MSNSIKKLRKREREKQKQFQNSWSVNYRKPNYDALADPHASYYFMNKSMNKHLKTLRKGIQEQGHFVQKKTVKGYITQRMHQYNFVKSYKVALKDQSLGKTDRYRDQKRNIPFKPLKSQSSMSSFYNYNHPFGDSQPTQTNNKKLRKKSSKETLNHNKKRISDKFKSVQLRKKKDAMQNQEQAQKQTIENDESNQMKNKMGFKIHNKTISVPAKQETYQNAKIKQEGQKDTNRKSRLPKINKKDQNIHQQTDKNEKQQNEGNPMPITLNKTRQNMKKSDGQKNKDKEQSGNLKHNELMKFIELEREKMRKTKQSEDVQKIKEDKTKEKQKKDEGKKQSVMKNVEKEQKINLMNEKSHQKMLKFILQKKKKIQQHKTIHKQKKEVEKHQNQQQKDQN